MVVNPGAGCLGLRHQSIPASAGELGEAAERLFPPPCVAAGVTGGTDLTLAALRDPGKLSRRLSKLPGLGLPLDLLGFHPATSRSQVNHG